MVNLMLLFTGTLQSLSWENHIVYSYAWLFTDPC
jgi:hypothetical protein